MAARRQEGRAATCLDLFRVEELDSSDLRTRLVAARGLTRLVELLEVARQAPDYVECAGDVELFADAAWAAATLTYMALETCAKQRPRPAVKPLDGLDGGRP